jgi:DNA-binding response OmpR family regulator
MKLLIIEDEKELSNSIISFLNQEEMSTESYFNFVPI